MEAITYGFLLIDHEFRRNTNAFMKKKTDFEEPPHVLSPEEIWNRVWDLPKATHMVVEAMKPFFHEPWNSCREIPYQIRLNMWFQFKHENLVNENFEKRAQNMIKDTHFVSRKGGSRYLWLREDIWNQLLEKWNTEEWKQRSENVKANRASSKGGSLHSGGSIRFAAHRLRLEKAHGGDVSHATVFEETHKKKKKDGTRESWVEPRASETYLRF
ncbi:uncharacterized protein [Nicotiana tomentosiformis]|uniref:uncharacterized protein n=1 Tax=Nicotiana tomentosiformis TaxID=4098 RepID=UPI00388C6065